MVMGYLGLQDVVIHCQVITDWIESTQAQIFSHPIQNRNTEPNSKYSLKKYFQIVYSNALTLFRLFDCNCILSL